MLSGGGGRCRGYPGAELHQKQMFCPHFHPSFHQCPRSDIVAPDSNLVRQKSRQGRPARVPHPAWTSGAPSCCREPSGPSGGGSAVPRGCFGLQAPFVLNSPTPPPAIQP